MSFELERKIIIAILLFILIIFCGVAVFYFVSKNKEPTSLLEETLKREESKIEKKETNISNIEMKKNQVVKVLFGGDAMFDRYIRSVTENKGFDHIVQGIKPLLEDADLIVVNLEGPITENYSKSVGSEFESRENYIFTFSTDSAKWLADQKITVVNIGNNHVLNFGTDGLEQTRQNLKNAGVKYFGDPGNPEYRWYVKEIKDRKIGFVSYNQFIENGKEKALTDLSLAQKKSEVVIVYAHWGVEYQSQHNAFQQEVAHALIEAGADLIVGSHSHVIQDEEEYQGKKIYYSLGNFIFDQYFEERTRNGLMLRVTIGEGIEAIDEIKISMETNGQTKLSK